MAKKRILLSVHLTDKEQIWGIFYLLFSIFLLPSLIAMGIAYLPVSINSAWMNFIYFALNFLCIFCIFRGFFKRSLAYAGSHVGDFVLAVLLGFGGYWLCSWLLGLALTTLLPDFSNLNDSSIAAMAQGDFWIVAVSTVLLVPLAEEALHRGLIFGSLYQKSHLAAYLLSCAIFAAVHVMNYVGIYSLPHLLLAYAQYIPAGLMLAWAYRKSGSIFAPMLIHATINAISLFSLR